MRTITSTIAAKVRILFNRSILLTACSRVLSITYHLTELFSGFSLILSEQREHYERNKDGYPKTRYSID